GRASGWQPGAGRHQPRPAGPCGPRVRSTPREGGSSRTASNVLLKQQGSNLVGQGARLVAAADQFRESGFLEPAALLGLDLLPDGSNRLGRGGGGGRTRRRVLWRGVVDRVDNVGEGDQLRPPR